MLTSFSSKKEENIHTNLNIVFTLLRNLSKSKIVILMKIYTYVEYVTGYICVFNLFKISWSA